MKNGNVSTEIGAKNRYKHITRKIGTSGRRSHKFDYAEA